MRARVGRVVRTPPVYKVTICRCSIMVSTVACQATGVGSIPITCSTVVRKMPKANENDVTLSTFWWNKKRL